MRHLLVGLVAAAVAVLLPTWALAGNQEVAEKIAANLRQSGQLHDYKIGVKYQDGKAWLRGRVSSGEQMQTALRLVFETAGVAQVVNDLTIEGSGQVAPSAAGQAAQGPLLSVANSQAFGSPALTASPPGQPLQQVTGAVNPERLARYVLPGSPGAPHRLQTGSLVPNGARPVGLADRVATSFAPIPLLPVGANAMSQEPTLALPEVQAEIVLEPQAQLLVSDAGPTMATQPWVPRSSRPIPIAYTQPGGPMPVSQAVEGPVPQYVAPLGGGVAPVRYDQPHLPNYAWPSYAAYPNYAALTYPKQYSPTAWPYIGPFYPYPQVPLGWRKVTLEWHDGWWQLDFDDGPRRGFLSGLFRPLYPCK